MKQLSATRSSLPESLGGRLAQLDYQRQKIQIEFSSKNTANHPAVDTVSGSITCSAEPQVDQVDKTPDVAITTPARR